MRPTIQQIGMELQQRLEDAMRPLIEVQRQWEDAMRPLIEVQRQWEDAMRPLIEVQRQWEDAMRPLLPYTKALKAFEDTGWLPYHSALYHYVEESGEGIPLLESYLSDYYRENWSDIRKDMESRLESYNVDAEAKEVFREALSAHEVGHYRCVCRVLFPEIERIFRARFSNKRTGSIQIKSMAKEFVDDMLLEGSRLRKVLGLFLFGRLVGHLYESIKEDDELEKFAKDFVPNRHAAIHGLVSYSTHKHSVNMIIMTDYIFQILPAISISSSPPQ